MSRNLAPEHGPKRGHPLDPPDPVLPLPDARAALGPYFLPPEWWQEVLLDHEWWRTYATVPIDPPPARFPAHLIDARRLNLFRGITRRIEDHSTCPIHRPDYCDPYHPQAWHARKHSARCYRNRSAHIRVTGLSQGALV